jgi:hypothetical protein
MKDYVSNHMMKEHCLEFQKNNTNHQVSGILLYSSGVVMQYIEGTPEKIDTLFSNIVKDIRHHSFIKLLEEEIDNKIFKDWNMKFRVISIENMIDIRENMTRNENCVLEILRSFIKANNL